MNFKKSILVVLIILLIDQVVKIWIKTDMTLGSEIMIIDDWFRIHFTENKGMAFGWELGGDYGKLALSIFRIIAIFGITWYLFDLSRNKYPPIAQISIAIILAGAIGNIIDSAFYGIIFDASTYTNVAVLFPEAGGYGTFLHGSVVDMFYFPLVKGVYPDWIPYLGGSSFEFFRPVFNIADASITLGVILIILFRKKFTKKESPYDNETAPVSL